MTNAVKGEVIFEAGGKTYTFKLGTNAQVMIENKTGLSMGKFLNKERLEDMGAKDIRLIFWAGLFRQHQCTEEEVGDIIDEIGPQRVADIFLEAFEVAKSKVENGAAGEPRPPKSAKARIGMNS